MTLGADESELVVCAQGEVRLWLDGVLLGGGVDLLGNGHLDRGVDAHVDELEFGSLGIVTGEGMYVSL